MLAAHADEIAMSVNFITAEGFIHVRRTGGIDPAITKAQRVTIHTRQGPVLGVVGNVAPHLTRGDSEPKAPKIHELFIDIGVASKDAALKLVRIGDPITLNDRFEMLRGDLAVARAFDNRIGTFAVAETLRLLKPLVKKLNVEVCAVANVQEEVGLLEPGKLPTRSIRRPPWWWMSPTPRTTPPWTSVPMAISSSVAAPH